MMWWCSTAVAQPDHLNHYKRSLTHATPAGAVTAVTAVTPHPQEHNFPPDYLNRSSAYMRRVSLFLLQATALMIADDC